MKNIKRSFVGLFSGSVILIAVFTLWAKSAAPADTPALDALVSDLTVKVTENDGYITFEPVQSRATIGFVFYPGGRVDYRAYAPVLRRIAAEGYFVAVVEVRLNLAYFEVAAADRVITAYPGIEHWAVGGHSLGGIAAASYAADRSDVVRGLVFWASYPSDNTLKSKSLMVMSIHGTNDGLITAEDIERSKVQLPTGTRFVSIDGGNHSQFGSYGFQNGDNPASITPEEQWSLAADATVSLLASLVE